MDILIFAEKAVLPPQAELKSALGNHFALGSKIRDYHIMKKVVFLSLLLLLQYVSFGQGASESTIAPKKSISAYSVNAGLGLRFTPHLGFDKRMGNYAVGLDIGSAIQVWQDDKNLYFMLDQKYYFAQKGLTGQNCIYVSAGFHYIIDEIQRNVNHIILISPSIGKEFNLDERIALNLGTGTFWPVYQSNASGCLLSIPINFRIELVVRI